MTSSAKSITEEADSLGALLRAPYRYLQARLYAELAETFPEIRAAHSSVFRTISSEGSRLVDLAEQAQMTKQSMAYLVSYLEKHQFVETVDHPADGRAVLVRLTAKGRKVIDLALAVSRRLEDDAARQLGETKLSTLRKLLTELGSAFRDAR
jgi:DNA-binding MarR family transcriptional regulator